MKRPIIFTTNNKGYRFIWVWKIALILSRRVTYNPGEKHIGITRGKKTILLYLGKYGFGFGHN